MTHTMVDRMCGGGNRYQHDVERICVDNDPTGYKTALSRYCKKPVSTFPQVFVDGNHVGGYSDFVRLFSNAI